MFIVVVEAVVEKDGKYLIIKRSDEEEHAPGTYSLPGGKVEVNKLEYDVLEKNLVREVLEETGIEIIPSSINYLESKFFYSGLGEPIIDVVYSCTCDCMDIGYFDKKEVSDVRWLTYKEITEDFCQCMPYYVKDTLMKYYDRGKNQGVCNQVNIGL